MTKTENIPEITAAFQNQVRELRELADRVSQIGNRLAEINSDLDSVNRNLRFRENAQSAGNPETVSRDTGTSPNQCRIINFPGTGPRNPGDNGTGRPNSRRQSLRAPAPFLAAPGAPLPPGLPDFRSALQRDGLILLGWDNRDTEEGERYTAYWVTSSGTPRFYASRPLPPEDFPSARPDHKSYAAEDGIEFYGQEAPVYQVHVAPELMMSNPRHGELRLVHINILQRQGSDVDFNYPYLLKTERKHNKRPKAAKIRRSRKTGA